MKSSLALIIAFLSLTTYANEPWKVNLIDKKQNITLRLNLYAEDIEVPDMEMFGPMNGYLGGNIYGVWPVTSFEIKKKKAILRLSNDLGSETQEAELTQTSDSTYILKLTGSTVIKKVNGRKLVKIAPTLNMIKIKD